MCYNISSKGWSWNLAIWERQDETNRTKWKGHGGFGSGKYLVQF